MFRLIKSVCSCEKHVQDIWFRHISGLVCRKLVPLVSSKSLQSWLCVKSGCRMIRQVICRYASVFCTLSFAVRCCRGLPNSLEKEAFHFLRFLW